MKGIREPAKLVTAIAVFHFAFLLFIGILGLAYIAFHFQEIEITKFLNFLKQKRKSHCL